MAKAKVMRGGMKAPLAKNFGAVSAEQGAAKGVKPVKGCPGDKSKGGRDISRGSSRDNVRPPKVSGGDVPFVKEKRVKL